MSENKAMKRRLSDRSVWVPRIVLFLSLVITAIAGYYTKYKIEANEKKEFGYACNELKKAISNALNT